jgi:hypothetical protein
MDLEAVMLKVMPAGLSVVAVGLMQNYSLESMDQHFRSLFLRSSGFM